MPQPLTEMALQRIKVNKSTGPDNIPGWLLRDNATVLARPLTALFNSSLREGVIPAMWKTANVIPLPKKRPPRLIENYIRPISLTPIISKTFESIIMTLVDTVLEDKINDNQYGSTSGTCTTDALVEMLHQWYEATDACNTYVRIIALDFSKAFDLINHKILLTKLEANGVPPHVLRWMASFPLDRTQRVKIGKHTSSIGKPNGGVPQGTVSGPRNVIMYINDLTKLAPMYKYVDDSTIFEIYSGNVISTIQQSIDDVVKWTDDNDTRLNCDECKEMIVDFSRNQGQSSDVQDIFINEKTLEKVSHIKMLGVIV